MSVSLLYSCIHTRPQLALRPFSPPRSQRRAKLFSTSSAAATLVHLWRARSASSQRCLLFGSAPLHTSACARAFLLSCPCSQCSAPGCRIARRPHASRLCRRCRAAREVSGSYVYRSLAKALRAPPRLPHSGALAARLEADPARIVVHVAGGWKPAAPPHRARPRVRGGHSLARVSPFPARR